MKSTKIFSMLMAIAVMVGMSSCLSHDNKGMEQTFKMSGYVNAFVGTDYVSGDVSYNYTINYDQSTARMEITGLTLPDGTKYSTVVLEDLKVNANSSGWLVLSGNNIKATGLSGYIPDLIFDTFDFQVHDNFVSDELYSYNTPYVNISYRFAGYNVRSMPTGMIVQGITTVKSQMGDDYVSEAPAYGIEVNIANGKGDIMISGAKFAEKMPAMNMKFSGVPFTVDDSGWYILRTDELIPSIVGSDKKETPYPNYPISDLTLALNPASGMNFHFVCTIITETEVDGEKVTTKMPFDVTVVAQLQNPR